MHSICFPTDTGETNMMRKPSSLEFLGTSTKVNLSVDIYALRLKAGNYAYDNIVDDFEDIVDLVNSKGGWIVYG